MASCSKCIPHIDASRTLLIRIIGLVALVALVAGAIALAVHLHDLRD